MNKVICHTIPIKHKTMGGCVEHIRIGKVYERHDYMVFGTHPFTDISENGKRVLCMRRKDFDEYFSFTLLGTVNPRLIVP